MTQVREIEDAVVNMKKVFLVRRSKDDELKIESIVLELVSQKNYESKSEFSKRLDNLKRKCRFSHQIKHSEVRKKYDDMLENGKVSEHPQMAEYLRTKVGKSASGILSVTVFTSPFPEYIDDKGRVKKQRFTCEWNCYYCPNHPDHPRSYLPDEPGCLRAERCGFDVIVQMWERIETLRKIGHPVDKLEVLVLGGTWESYPRQYQELFIRDLFYAANIFFDADTEGYRGSDDAVKTVRTVAERVRPPKSLLVEQTINESTRCKIIGLTLETRPDTINMDSIREFRRLGCTRLQLGIQHTDNMILKKINRGHTIECGNEAMTLLRDCCYKVDIHLMPDLPGATVEADEEMFGNLLGVKDVKRCGNHYIYQLENEYMQADQWKIYPCEVTPWTIIEKWYKEGKYVPYADQDDDLKELLIWTKARVFPWIRLNRVIRDIPNQHILGGNQNTNMRQELQREMKKRGLDCKCIRCREVGLNRKTKEYNDAQLFIREYGAGDGTELFISFESPDEKYIFGFVRLRLAANAGKDGDGNAVFDSLVGCALIRELHVYGQLVTTYELNGVRSSQHAGFGSRLMAEAERISWERGFRKMAVIAGIGTRNYYRKLGYRLEETFMVKKLKCASWCCERQIALCWTLKEKMKLLEHQIIAMLVVVISVCIVYLVI